MLCLPQKLMFTTLKSWHWSPFTIYSSWKFPLCLKCDSDDHCVTVYIVPSSQLCRPAILFPWRRCANILSNQFIFICWCYQCWQSGDMSEWSVGYDSCWLYCHSMEWEECTGGLHPGWFSGRSSQCRQTEHVTNLWLPYIYFSLTYIPIDYPNTIEFSNYPHLLHANIGQNHAVTLEMILFISLSLS